MTVKLLLLLLPFLSGGYSLWDASVERSASGGVAGRLDGDLAHNMDLIVTQMNRCVPHRIQPFTANELRRIMGKHLKRHWNALRMDLLTAAKQNDYEKLDACLSHVHLHIKRYHRALKRVHQLERHATLRELLSDQQIEHLQHIFDQTDSVDAVEQQLNKFLKQMPKSFVDRKLMPQLIADLGEAPERRGRSLKASSSLVSSTDGEGKDPGSNTSDEHPRPLNEEQLAWMGDKEKAIIQRLKTNGAKKWDVLKKIGELYFYSRKDERQKSYKTLTQYCTENLEKLLGAENFAILKGIYSESATVEKVEAKFHEIVGQLSIEGDRMKAEHYGQFCRKIFRIVHFEPARLTSWLSAKQRFLLGEMIQDPDIGDEQVYEKMFEFYNSTTGEQRDEAQEKIENGCRWFIAHKFGEDIEEEIDSARFNSSVSKQQIASQLAFYATQLETAGNRKHVKDALPICTRIYLGYDYSCECNGHSDTCDSAMHTCTSCAHNTYGVQCEKCVEGFTRNPSNGHCVSSVEDAGEEAAEEETEPECQCNGHSNQCDSDGHCLNCAHNTEGEQCETCARGFYGDGRDGREDDCTPCPCPNDGACRVNGGGLVQCLECPQGTHGITCEKKDSTSNETSDEKRARYRHRRHHRQRFQEEY